MPVFMDRHDLSESVTAENVAYLHQQDLKIQDRFSCRGLSYWFDERRHTAFCLVEAPDAAAIQAMHDYAHGQVATRITEVDGSLVESFLGGIEDAGRPGEGTLEAGGSSPFRILLFMSLKELLPRKPSAPFGFPAEFKKSLDGLLRDSGGRLVSRSERETLISFVSVSAALRTVALVRSHFDEQADTSSAVLKIGLSAGVPLTDQPSLFADAVKLAMKVCDMVRGEVVVSAEVMAAWQDENHLPSAEGTGFVFLTRQDEAFLCLLLGLMEDRWSDACLKVEDLCRRVACSKSGLYRKMRELTGVSPHAFISEYRLQQALRLLYQHSENVAGTAFAAGFTSPSYFSKCFRRRFGSSPSDFMR